MKQNWYVFYARDPKSGEDLSTLIDLNLISAIKIRWLFNGENTGQAEISLTTGQKFKTSITEKEFVNKFWNKQEVMPEK